MFLQVYNSTDEIAKAASYPLIRLFTAALKDSSTPLEELEEVEQPWSVATPGTPSNLACIILISQATHTLACEIIIIISNN